MQTLKTAIVVVLLLVVFYGVYEMLNRPPVEVPREVVDLGPESFEDLDIDLGSFSDDMPYGDTAGSGAFAPPPAIPGGELPVPPTPAGAGSHYGTAIMPDNPVSSGSLPSGTVPDGAFPVPPIEMPSTGPGELGSPPTMPPTAPPTMPPTASPTAPAADSSVMTIPGAPQLQHNPYLNGDVVPKPSVARNNTSQIGAIAFQRAWKTAQTQIADGDYAVALSSLSMFYMSEDLTPEQQRELLATLDPLAGRVIYSREHLLEQPYRVGRSETLMDIADQFNVPYVLLQKINGIEDPRVLLPNSELKVVRGPFRADVDLEAQELTVFLDRLYAGRFPITLGADPQPVEGEFEIRDKQLDKTYISITDNRTFPANSPANPFGRMWLDLGREVCIHGSPMGGAEQNRGCISLSPRDANDVYSILSVGSKIRILR